MSVHRRSTLTGDRSHLPSESYMNARKSRCNWATPEAPIVAGTDGISAPVERWEHLKTSEKMYQVHQISLRTRNFGTLIAEGLSVLGVARGSLGSFRSRFPKIDN
jgi:hypothetical protein